jgi:1-acyl-sn-glycerol-3-phosphate acyltransferase
MFSPEFTRDFSITVVLAAAISIVVVGWQNARRTGFKPSQYPIYFFGLALTRILWRARVIGRMKLPPHGGAVIVSNHRGPIDPAFVGLACLGRVRWMVAREYFNVPLFGRMLKLLEAIPTRRGGIDTAAVKQTIRSARDGDYVGVFPEGRINDTNRLLLSLRNGAALIALEAQVPIVPCYIEGSPYDPKNMYGFFLRAAKTTITVGRPIDILEYRDRADSRDVHNELTQRIGQAIAALAGRPDYVPELVSRRQNGIKAAEDSVSNT